MGVKVVFLFFHLDTHLSQQFIFKKKNFSFPTALPVLSYIKNAYIHKSAFSKLICVGHQEIQFQICCPLSVIVSDFMRWFLNPDIPLALPYNSGLTSLHSGAQHVLIKVWFAPFPLLWKTESPRTELQDGWFSVRSTGGHEIVPQALVTLSGEGQWWN